MPTNKTQEIIAYLVNKYPYAYAEKLSIFISEKLGKSSMYWYAGIMELISQNKLKRTIDISNRLQIIEENDSLTFGISNVINDTNDCLKEGDKNSGKITEENIDMFYSGFQGFAQQVIYQDESDKGENLEKISNPQLIVLNELKKVGEISGHELSAILLKLKNVSRGEKSWSNDINSLIKCECIEIIGGYNRIQPRKNKIRITKKGEEILSANANNFKNIYEKSKLATKGKQPKLSLMGLSILKELAASGNGLAKTELKQKMSQIKGDFYATYSLVFGRGYVKESEKLCSICPEKIVEDKIDLEAHPALPNKKPNYSKIQKKINLDIYSNNKRFYEDKFRIAPILDNFFQLEGLHYYALTPLVSAILFGDAELFKQSLNIEQAVNLPVLIANEMCKFLPPSQQELITPLMIVCYFGRLNQALDLLNVKADPNLQASSSKRTALHWAMKSKNITSESKVALLDIFLQRANLNVNLKDVQGNTILYTMIEQNEVACVEKFLTMKPILPNNDVNEGLSPLLFAIQLGRNEITRLILKSMNLWQLETCIKSKAYQQIMNSKNFFQSLPIQAMINDRLSSLHLSSNSFFPVPQATILPGPSAVTQNLKRVGDELENMTKKQKGDEEEEFGFWKVI